MNYLSYKRLGKGRPLVLVHGYLGGQTMWRFQEDLKEDFDLIMPSLAGYGESADLTAPSTIRENAQLVFELLDHLQIETFYLLGHSMGGRTAMTTACRFPDRVDGVISLDTAPVNENARRNQFGRKSYKVISFMHELSKVEGMTR